MLLKAWKQWKRFLLGGSLAVGVSLGAASGVSAQAPAPAHDPAALQELQRRLEALEKQNQQLMQLLQQQQLPVATEAPAEGAGAGAVAPAPANKGEVEKIIKDYMKKEADDKKKKEDEEKKKKEDEGFVVGSDLNMKWKWDHGMWAETEDKAFRFHVGGRTQFDTIFYQAGDGVQFGNNGTGRVDDGVAFRRGRFAMEGSFWEVIDFNCEYDFTNTDTVVSNTAPTTNATGAITALNQTRRVIPIPVPTDLWVGFRGNPQFGTLRIGNLKPALSFEHLTSSRFLNFIERSYGFDMYVGGPDNGFTPGFLYMNNFLDDRVYFAASMTRFNQTVHGFNTGDGEWASGVRAGFFPYWEHDGRCAMWLGLGYRHVDPDFIPQSSREFRREPLGQYRIRARTELRNGPAELHTPLIDIFPFAESAVPDERSPDEAVFLPGRNVLLLAKAFVWCSLNKVEALALASLAGNPFPDATPAFFRNFGAIVNEAVGCNVQVVLPYRALHKDEVLRRGRGMPLEWTFSCLRPTEGAHCGRCNKCAERQAGFRAAGLPDPTRYREV